jgi:hypothetical protein
VLWSPLPAGVAVPSASAQTDRCKVNPTFASPERRSPVALAVLVVALVAALATVAIPSLRPSGLLRDFDAFYCAGSALRGGADPYRAEPLGACERIPKPDPLISGTPGLAMPAPLPPYALVPFELVAALPYVAAAVIWTLAGFASLAIAVWAMRRSTGLPIEALVAAFALTDGFASLALGQIAPIAIAAIALAAMLLAEGRDEWAAVVAGCSMLEPHLGVPVCAALFFYRARARLPLAGVAVVCVAASLVASGAQTSLEYIRAVVPAHALSEVANEKQFSLTYALHRVGLSDADALRAGELSYCVMVVLGLAAAGALAKRTNGAAIVLIPPAFAVIGGPFVHIIQIAAAIPAALFVFANGSPRARRVAGIAIVALAIPWIQFANLGTAFVVFAAAAAALLANAFVDERPAVALVAAGATVAILEGVMAVTVPNVPDAVPVLVANYDPHALAETSWTLYVRTIGTVNAFAFDLAKVPTVAALLALGYATLVESFGSEVNPSVAIGGKGAAISRRTTTR